MNKQAEKQNYEPKGPTCATCNNRVFKLELPAWMAQQPGVWNETYKLEKNQRCGIGGFAIKKQGCCDLWSKK